MPRPSSAQRSSGPGLFAAAARWLKRLCALHAGRKQRPVLFKQVAVENALFRLVHARSAGQIFWLGRISSAHL